MHDRWVAYIQQFHFTLKHKSCVTNKGVDALSRRASLLTTLHSEDFGDIWGKCQQTCIVVNSMYIQDGFLFRGNQFYIPKSSLRE